MSTPTARYIPLDAPESANLTDVKTLLPLAVYQDLARLINEALQRTSALNFTSKVNEVRSHNAVSIDGERGTGKTSVLVNLKRYLENEHKEALKQIHILEPVDPTLLEDHESLFLHVIVAAVLSDERVKQSQSFNPDAGKRLNQALEKLAHALESVERQKEERGMDKLRALFGNKHLADCVQDFFKAALVLLEKKLLVLPIDDVDTSLNRAFENLEIVRRYLTTPYVLPIVSGDRELYREVTWRDFHGRLTKDSNYRTHEAYEIALDLANEYQRKVLPPPRRLNMPPVHEYLQDQNITLGKVDNGIISLPNFHAWLSIFLAGPVNGREGSDLAVPIPSVRALTQLVNRCSALIPELPLSVRKAESPLQVRRVWQMPKLRPEVIEAFHLRHQELGKEMKREYGPAYRVLANELAGQQVPVSSVLGKDEIKRWEKTLIDYFRYEPQAGAVYLVLQAYQHWQSLAGSNERQASIFDTPLFQPLRHDAANLAQFDKEADLADWKDRLKGKLPESWLSRLDARKTLLPYPVAEVGVNSSMKWKYWEDCTRIQASESVQHKATFLISLLSHNNYYTEAKQSMMLNVGRIFELLIASLVGPLHFPTLQGIVQEAPFYSTSALAPTKTLELENKPSKVLVIGEGDDDVENRPDYVFDMLNTQLVEFQREISKWREVHELDNVRFSPWLIYKVFNKVYSQVASSKSLSTGMTNIGTALEMVGMVFYATWSAFGSFEKGGLFGLPDVVATVNLNSPRNFEQNDHFRVNILPFSLTTSQIEQEHQAYQDKKAFGESSRTASYYLANHPLRIWLDEIPVAQLVNKKGVASASVTVKDSIKKDRKTAKQWLCEQFGIAATVTLTQKRLVEELGAIAVEQRDQLIKAMANLYPKANQLDLLKKAYNTLANIQS
ncbi:hypothetical protein DLM_0411 [Aquitalea magnusonii]|uniref:KAP NTPase domain-containing protein n=1 Tax=Aquitalea magnusonii TaxID=332411 RepID=A0A3G9GB93_9NEIS|nr:antiviral RADAR system adenosine triphosphatase RdrA [Aquitalea magnusonii]BBF84083.1 hypothetical protein DLM_0411 [Aquitalea magnusonii]